MIDVCYLAAGKNKCTSAPGSVRQHLVLDSCGWPEGDERESEGERVKDSGGGQGRKNKGKKNEGDRREQKKRLKEKT